MSLIQIEFSPEKLKWSNNKEKIDLDALTFPNFWSKLESSTSNSSLYELMESILNNYKNFVISDVSKVASNTVTRIFRMGDNQNHEKEEEFVFSKKLKTSAFFETVEIKVNMTRHKIKKVFLELVFVKQNLMELSILEAFSTTPELMEKRKKIRNKQAFSFVHHCVYSQYFFTELYKKTNFKKLQYLLNKTQVLDAQKNIEDLIEQLISHDQLDYSPSLSFHLLDKDYLKVHKQLERNKVIQLNTDEIISTVDSKRFLLNINQCQNKISFVLRKNQQQSSTINIEEIEYGLMHEGHWFIKNIEYNNKLFSSKWGRETVKDAPVIDNKWFSLLYDVNKNKDGKDIVFMEDEFDRIALRCKPKDNQLHDPLLECVNIAMDLQVYGLPYSFQSKEKDGYERQKDCMDEESVWSIDAFQNLSLLNAITVCFCLSQFSDEAVESCVGIINPDSICDEEAELLKMNLLSAHRLLLINNVATLYQVIIQILNRKELTVSFFMSQLNRELSKYQSEGECKVAFGTEIVF